MPTRADVLRMAFRRLGLVSADEALDADQESYGGEILDSLWAEQAVPNITWGLDAVPQSVLLPLAHLLAVDLAPHYDVPSERRSRAMVRFMAAVYPNDAEDRSDTDGDGIISDEEFAAGKRARFY